MQHFKILVAALLLTATQLSAFDAFIGDDFEGGAVYSNKTSGSLDWEGSWVEFQDESTTPFSNPSNNNISIQDAGGNSVLHFQGFVCTEPPLPDGSCPEGNRFKTQNIVRSLNPEGKANVVLSLDYTPTNQFVTNNRKVLVQLWDFDDQDWETVGTLAPTTATTTHFTYHVNNSAYLSPYSKIRFKSGDTIWNEGDDIDIDNVRFEFDYKDTDGDGKADDDDVDDDNDGILDTREFSSRSKRVGITSTWTKINDDKMEGKIGDEHVTIEDLGGAFRPFVDPPEAAFNPHSNTFWGPSVAGSLQAATSCYVVVPGDHTGVSEIKITLPKKVKRVLIHEDRIGATGYQGDNSLSSSIRLTLIDNTGQFRMTMGNSNGNLEVNEAEKWFQRYVGVSGQTQTDSAPGHGGSTDASSAGTIIIESDSEFDELRFNVTDANDGFYMIIETVSEFTGAKDSDHDGISDQFDLDSDNDGIPDTIEAQLTKPNDNQPIHIAGGTNVDTNGLPAELSGTALTPVDNDSDGIPDILDLDSDDDDISDCSEGNIHTKDDCPLTDVTADGMASAAGSDGNYGKIYGNIDDVEVDLFGWDATNVAYRIPNYCGSKTWTLKKDQWKTISVPCKITESISAIFGSLGSYGDNADWVMYEQEDDYSGDYDKYRLMSTSDTMTPGKGYWIITSKPDTTIEAAGSLTVAKTTRQLPVGHSVTSPSFTEVHTYDGMPASSGEIQKVLVGNPFPFPIHLGNVFLKHGSNDYLPMYDNGVNAFSNKTVYIYDQTGTDINNYVPKVPAGTPGFGDVIEPGIGFWLKLNNNSGSGSNKIDYPFEN